FATPSNVGEFLDLNAVVVVSADGVGNIPNVLDQSRWADEPIPPTVVLLDADKPALDVVERITKNTAEGKLLIERAFVSVISEIVQPFGSNSIIVSVEDIIPKSLYRNAVEAYFKKWMPETIKQHGKKIADALANGGYGKDGLVASTKAIFMEVKPEYGGEFDKMGVLQEVIALASSRATDTKDDELAQLRKNIVAICDFIREALAKSRTATAKHSTTQAVKRIIHDFNRLNKDN